MCEPRDYKIGSNYPDKDIYTLLNNWIDCYLDIYHQTDKLLREYCEDPDTDTEQIGLPVPIDRIADWLHFRIERKSLNRTRDANLGLVLGRLERIDDQWVIFLEEPQNTTMEQERYAIANLLGQYYAERNAEFAECAEVRIPSRASEILAMLFTSFLILPPRSFFHAADEYADVEKRPINQELMLLALSKQAGIPYYYTVICYEHLKVLAANTRMKEFRSKLLFLEKTCCDSELPSFENSIQLAPEKFFY